MPPSSSILIVDDSALGRKALETALAGLGYGLAFAADGPEALAKAAELAPDLILLDVMMPGMDGYEVLRRLRADPKTAEMPVIIVTALDDRESRLRGFDAGADDFLSKPFDRAEVRARAHTITRLNRYRRLLDERTRFQRLFEFAPDGILIVDDAGVVRQANPAAERLLDERGTSPAGRPLASLVPAADRPGLADCLAAARAAGAAPRRLELALPREGREAVWVELVAGPFPMGDEQATQVVVRDITARRQAEERVRQLAAMLDLASDAIVVEDAAGRVCSWNRGAEQTYGWSRDEVLGRPRGQFLNGDAGSVRQDEVRQRRKDGGEIVVQSRETVVRDGAGRVHKVIVNTDVTEQKALEEKYLRAQRMESLGALAGGIAHDLNNVLTPLAMGLPLLSPFVPENSPQRPLIQTMEACVERGAGMVKQILAFVRGQDSARSSLELASLLREVGKLVTHSLPARVRLDVDVARDLWPVRGDVTQLYQAVMNLVINARDAMSSSGGRLTIAAANQPADGAGGKAGVRLVVRDTGPGIPAELQDRIFDPFFTTKPPGQGTGLGLTTAAEIVRAHGGTIEVTSGPGRGAEFRIVLPAVVNRPASSTAGRPELPAGNGELVLVADDERSVRELTRAILETYGYRTVVASDGGQAITMAREHPVELAVLDWRMPDMDGGALARVLREHRPTLPVLLISGGRRDSTGEPPAFGDVPFLPKPFSASKLLQAVRGALSSPPVMAAVAPPLMAALV